MRTRIDAKRHVYHQEPVINCETTLLSELVSPGMRALDVGCASTGRSAKLLRQFGCEVCSIDVNSRSLTIFRQSGHSHQINLIAADMCHLPFADNSFALTLVALNGLDYLIRESERITALREWERVLIPGGYCMFNTLNRIGVITSPRLLHRR